MTDTPDIFPTPALSNAAEHVLGPWTPRAHLLEGLTAVRTADRAHGPAYTIRLRRAADRSRENAARVLAAYDAAPAGSIVVVQVIDDVGGAVMGDIIAHRLKLNGVAGVVVEGPVRDIDGLDQFGPPIRARRSLPAQPPSLPARTRSMPRSRKASLSSRRSAFPTSQIPDLTFSTWR